jgi:hypothetical protein
MKSAKVGAQATLTSGTVNGHSGPTSFDAIAIASSLHPGQGEKHCHAGTSDAGHSPIDLHPSGLPRCLFE